MGAGHKDAITDCDLKPTPLPPVYWALAAKLITQSTTIQIWRDSLFMYVYIYLKLRELVHVSLYLKLKYKKLPYAASANSQISCLIEIYIITSIPTVAGLKCSGIVGKPVATSHNATRS